MRELTCVCGVKGGRGSCAAVEWLMVVPSPAHLFVLAVRAAGGSVNGVCATCVCRGLSLFQEGIYSTWRREARRGPAPTLSRYTLTRHTVSSTSRVRHL